VKVTPRSAEQARREQASSRELIKPGWVTSLINEAAEGKSRKGRPMITLYHLVQLPDGERELRDWLVDAPAVAEKFRSAVESVEALDRYEHQHEVTAEDFAGRTVQIRLGIEKGGRGKADRNFVDLYRRAVASAVVTPIRSAG
jgi:hypothetical protein